MAIKDKIPVGMSLPHRSPDAIDMATVRHVAQRAEALGFSDLWVTENTLDHVFSFDPALILTYAAAVTTRIRLGVAVVVLPIHNPSHVASQFASLDYVSQGFRLPAVNAPNDPVTIPERLVTTHRLQAFSAEYFTADSRLFSYSQENCRASDSVRQARQKPKPFLATPLADSEPESHDVTLEDLIRFFTNPARFFLNRRLQIFLPETNEELSEREPFVLDGLNRYQLRQQLVERDLKGASPTEIANIETATGQLPLGAVGTMDFKRTNEAVDAFLERLAPHLPSSPIEPLHLDLALGGFAGPWRDDGGRFQELTWSQAVRAAS